MTANDAGETVLQAPGLGTGLEGADVIKALAPRLPGGVFAERWRETEPWLELLDARVGGRRYLSLPGLLAPAAAEAIATAVKTLPFSVLKTELLTARRCLLDGAAPPPIGAWLEVMASPVLRGLCGSVLGRPLPGGLVINAWLLQQHDYMGVHPDGVYYRGTFSLGLNPAWDAAMGGAIAFGDKGPDGFEVAEWWYPHLGDGLLFAPDVDTWHCVEAVIGQNVRLSLTGWWVEPENALSYGYQAGESA